MTRIRCLRCLNVSSREEAFTDLSLAFPPTERCRRRRLGSVMLPAEDLGGRDPPPPSPAQVPSRVGPRRQRKHCVTGDAPPSVLDIEGLGPQGRGGQSSGEKEEEVEEEVEEEAQEEERTQEEEEEEEKEKEEEEEKAEKEKEAETTKEKEDDGPGPGSHRGAAAPAGEGSRSVLDLVNYFLSPERLTAENRYYCEPCASLQDAERAVELSRGPRYLILTLLRFSFDLRTMRRRKILDDVAVPLLLRLPLAGGRGQAYDLCSVVVHSGVSSESGHYYCYAREGTARPAPSLGAADRPEPEHQWYLFNDTRVSFSSFESVSNVTSFFPKDTAYVLFYRQRPGEGPEAEPGSPRGRTEPTLHKDLMEAISKDNVLYLQVSRAAGASELIWGAGFPALPPAWRVLCLLFHCPFIDPLCWEYTGGEREPLTSEEPTSSMPSCLLSLVLSVRGAPWGRVVRSRGLRGHLGTTLPRTSSHVLPLFRVRGGIRILSSWNSRAPTHQTSATGPRGQQRPESVRTLGRLYISAGPSRQRQGRG